MCAESNYSVYQESRSDALHDMIKSDLTPHGTTLSIDRCAVAKCAKILAS